MADRYEFVERWSGGDSEMMDPDKLDRLAKLLDGFDDDAAAEARRRATEIRLEIGWSP